MLKKIITAVAVVALMLAMFTSCEGILNPGNGGQTPGGNTTNGGNSKGGYKSIIYENDTLDLFEVWTKSKDLIGPVVPFNVYTDVAQKDGEIVFGNTNRAITAEAKAELEQALETSTRFDSGYIIYAKGNNIAVYWTNADMADIAIAKFLEVCINQQKLQIPDGVAAYEYYKLSDFENEKYWLALEAVADPDTVQALKKIHNFYEPDKLIEWMANLWDPINGAFYYSISARDNEPFLPDIESTRQITSLLVSSGALESRNDFPKEMKEQIVNFALNLQSAKDGYFYHPQWPNDKSKLNTDRYGRDISSALGIISDMNIDLDGDGIEDDVYPYYCAPNGTKCALHRGTTEKCSFPITVTASYIGEKISSSVTTNLTSGVSAAVSKVSKSNVVATAVSQHPDYSSREAFKAWLLEYNANIKENSGQAHKLSAISGEIRAHGYADIVVDHLKQVQEEVFEEQIAAGVTPTGLWQRHVDYNAVWGLLKYNSYFANSDLGYHMDYKYIPYIVNTCIQVIAMPIGEESFAANGIYNMWQGIQRILRYTKSEHGQDKVDELIAQIRVDAPALIENSLAKVKLFKRDDGSFSYSISGKSSTTIYGAAIALGVVEGDVNAVSLCVQMYECMYECLGYKKVPLFNSNSADKFFEITSNSLPIEKNKLNATIDFESLSMPSNVATKNNSADGHSELTEDPTDSSNQVLHFVAGASANGGEEINITPNIKGSNCYVFETRMYFSDKTDKNTYLIQYYIGNAYLLIIGRSGDNIIISESATDANRKHEKEIIRIPVNEWFKIRVEYYVNGEEENGLESPQTKIWINDSLVRVSDVYFGADTGAEPKNIFNSVKMYFLKSPSTDLYIDDVYCISLNKVFDPDNKYVDEY